MTILDVSVSQFHLAVDASDTISAMVAEAPQPWGRRLHDALDLATRGADAAYAVAPHVTVNHDDVRPETADAAGLSDVSDRHVGGVLARLQRSGLVTAHTLWSDTDSGSYLCEGRIVTAVRVLRPFALVGVNYALSADARCRVLSYGTAYADRWEITERTYIVPAGWYLVGEVGDMVCQFEGVACWSRRSDDDGGSVPELMTLWLADIEGFCANRCSAQCAECGAKWSAEDGSWWFEPDWCQAPTWVFDDAEDIDDDAGTVACPACATGRVGFCIS